MTAWQKKLTPRLINGYWSIQGTVPVLGRIRKQYPTKEIAESESEVLKAKVSNALAGGEIRETLLSKSQEKDAVGALNLMEGTPAFEGWSLTQVVAWATKSYRADVIEMSIDEASRLLLEEMEQLNRKATTINGVRRKLEKLSRWFPGKNVSDLSTEVIRSYISDDSDAYGPFAGRSVSKTTRTNELTVLKAFFTFCENRKYIKESPIDGSVKRPGIDRAEIVALDLEEVYEFVSICDTLPVNIREYAIPYFALSLFAGLRPQELRPEDGEHQVMWEDFTWRKKESTLVVNYKVGKVTSRRVVKLPENCVAWVKPFDRKTGPVIGCSYAQWRGMFDYIRAKAGYKVYGQHFKHLDPGLAHESNDANRKRWVTDVLRHTAISYYLELNNNNKDLVSAWAGNSPAVIDQHYRSLIKGTDELSPSEVTFAYWRVMPSWST